VERNAALPSPVRQPDLHAALAFFEVHTVHTEVGDFEQTLQAVFDGRILELPAGESAANTLVTVTDEPQILLEPVMDRPEVRVVERCGHGEEERIRSGPRDEKLLVSL